nr:hypothetical protein [Tanacetum cinerariifolium]
MDIFAFIHTPDPTEVSIVGREWNEDEPRLLDTTIGRTVPLLPVAPDQQGDSTKGGLDANIQPVVEVANTVVEDAAPVQVRRQRKRKYVVVDAGGVSHPSKKSRDDHGTPSGAFVGGDEDEDEAEEEDEI